MLARGLMSVSHHCLRQYGALDELRQACNDPQTATLLFHGTTTNMSTNLLIQRACQSFDKCLTGLKYIPSFRFMWCLCVLFGAFIPVLYPLCSLPCLEVYGQGIKDHMAVNYFTVHLVRCPNTKALVLVDFHSRTTSQPHLRLCQGSVGSQQL